jgi:hypothetical protein
MKVVKLEGITYDAKKLNMNGGTKRKILYKLYGTPYIIRPASEIKLDI